ncbi:hypothetical protein [Cellulomonas sp.]|uniref:hypothetical protein n=1 Tax=Cellulomonas sp. TaxID=40001 RepID=UPI001B1E9DE3|nr:hypothetical protein [Cellulomonas sp.]MBO9555578.1 hypothetical protein [Cellulomonas sp.]
MRAAAEVVPYRDTWTAAGRRDGVYRRLEYPLSTCEGWGPDDARNACGAEGRTRFRRPGRWLRDGRYLCGECKRADEAWRRGETVAVEGLDPEIRAALVAHIEPDGTQRRVRHEVLVGGLGAVEVRIDVLAVTGADPGTGAGGLLEAFEIKSDADSVARLPRQITGYEQVAQRCWLAVGSRHHAKATALLPAHWGVLVHDSAGLRLDRPADPNPHVSPRLAMNLVVGRPALNDIAKRAGHLARPVSRMYVQELREHAAAVAPREWVLQQVARHVIPPAAPMRRAEHHQSALDLDTTREAS